jgi:hypothetical protein
MHIQKGGKAMSIILKIEFPSTLAAIKAHGKLTGVNRIRCGSAVVAESTEFSANKIADVIAECFGYTTDPSDHDAQQLKGAADITQ